MDDAIKVMLSRYNCNSSRDYQNALKEIIQEIALLGLWRAKFFEKAAFYGGTALRILYELDRFSEDLDFSLLVPDKDFQLNHYLSAVRSELLSFGFSVTLDTKVKTMNTAIQSAFIKAGTREHFLKIQVPQSIQEIIHSMDLIKIKIEIDIDPPGEFETEAKLLLQPIPFRVNTYQLPDLFAGKLHAILCRQWKTRIKGRDWYDLVWYITRGTPVRMRHLQKRLEQTGAWDPQAKLEIDDLMRLLTNKIDQVNFVDAKKDVSPFLKNSSAIELWSSEFFRELIAKMKIAEKN